MWSWPQPVAPILPLQKILAGNEIFTFIRRSEMLSVSHMHGFDAEVVDLIAAPKSTITKKRWQILMVNYRSISLSALYFVMGNGRQQWGKRRLMPEIGPLLFVIPCI